MLNTYGIYPQAAQNQAEANLAGAGHANQRPIPSSYPQTVSAHPSVVKHEVISDDKDFHV